MRDFQTPLSDEDIGQLHVGDMIMLSGYIYTGRDAVLPKLVRMIEDGSIEDTGLCLQGGVKQQSRDRREFLRLVQGRY